MLLKQAKAVRNYYTLLVLLFVLFAQIMTIDPLPKQRGTCDGNSGPEQNITF